VISPDGTRELTYQTGLVVDGATVALDDGERTGVEITSPYILGTYPHMAESVSPRMSANIHTGT